MTDETEMRESEVATDGPVVSPEEGDAPDPAASGEVGAGEGGSPDPDEAGMAEEVNQLRSELRTLNDQHLRLAAEFDNYRKRNERDRSRLATRLQADLVASLLDVLDDLQRVEESGVGTDAESVLEGVRLVEKKFFGVLEAAGLETLDAEGAAFDPEVMEALAAVPTDDPDQDHRVADVFQRGYRFRGVLVRPARVRVWQYDEPGDGE